jgi:hypothetical protein
MAKGVIVGRRLILPAGIEEQEIFGFAQATNGQKIHDVTADPEFGLTREVIWLVSAGYFLHYGREKPFGHAFLQVSGEAENVVAKFTEVISDYFSTPSDDDLLQAIDGAKTVAETREALVMAGLGAPQIPDKRFLERLQTAIGAGDAEIREAGLWSALHTTWAECQGLVQGMASSDPSEALRQTAAGAMEHWTKKADAATIAADVSRCPFHHS